MDATEALFLLRRLGLSLEVSNGRLDVSPAELLDDDAVLLIRSHRDAIITELQNDSPAWAWLVNYGTHSTETYHYPERTRHQVLLAYPGAVSVERLPECLWPHDPSRKEGEA